MAQKILVTTDLSKSSRAGLRFAIQLASQQGSKLIFYHVLHTAMPTRWSPDRFKQFVDEQIAEGKDKLRQFVAGVYRQMKLTVKNPECIVEFKPFVDSAIIEYAISKKVDFICMSTRGAGVMKRILGTNTSAVLSKSPVPVLAVPHDYRRSRLSHILYASDLTALSNELRQVKKFADSSKSKLSVIHYGNALEPLELKRNVARLEKHFRSGQVKFHLEEYNLERSIPDNLKGAVKKFKPSLLAVFTKQDKGLLARIFPQSNAEKLSFDSRKPLLVYPK